MINIENIDVCGFKHAIRGMPAKGYRKTKTGYETFVKKKKKNISLGTYKTEEEAINVVYDFRIKRFINGCNKLKINPYDGRIYENNYIVFPTGHILNLHGVEIKGCIDRCGYREVILNKKRVLVHRIIAITFIPNPDNLPQINHKDGNKINNNIDNLEWCTRSYNLVHAYKNGLEKKMLGENHCSHKLTEDDVRYIRKNYIKRDSEYGATALAKKFNVDRTTILNVYNRKTWRHIT